MITTSIITTSYNNQNGLALTIGSALAAMGPNTEFLIADDASTDGTWDELERWHSNDTAIGSHLRIFRNEKNLGATQSRNRLLGLASGEYISILDSGDLILPTKIATHEAALELSRARNKKYTPPDVVVGRAAVKSSHSPWHSLPPQGFALGFDLAQPYHFVFSAMTFRRSALERVGGFEEPIYTAEGIDAFLKMGDRAAQIYLPQFACLKFRNPQSRSQRFSATHSALITQTLYSRTLTRRFGPTAAAAYRGRTSLGAD